MLLSTSRYPVSNLVRPVFKRSGFCVWDCLFFLLSREEALPPSPIENWIAFPFATRDFSHFLQKTVSFFFLNSLDVFFFSHIFVLVDFFRVWARLSD